MMTEARRARRLDVPLRIVLLFAGLSALLLAAESPRVGAANIDPAFATAERMARGVNVLGFDGIWDGGTDAPFRLSTFSRLRDAGFGHVRINLFGFKYMDESHTIAPEVLDDLDRVLDASIAAGLVPVIDQHDLELCQADPDACVAPLMAFWKQVSERYADRYPEAVFEILNEPGWRMTTDRWNALSADVLKLIRKTNPDITSESVLIEMTRTEG
jgi:endoglucanase